MKEKILEVLYGVVDTTNKGKTPDQKLEKSLNTVLFGSSSALDSLGLINFIVAVEEQIESAFGETIVLADDRALSQDPVPFSSLGALSNYIEILLMERKNG